MVDEGDGLPARGELPARLERGDVAFVARAFVDRVGAHAADAAGEELLGGVEVLRGELAVDRAHEDEALGDVLGAGETEAQLLEASAGARGRGDARLAGRTVQVELSGGPLQVGGGDAAAEDAVVGVGVEAGGDGADLVIAHDRAGGGVAEGLRLEAGGEVDVEDAAARERPDVVGVPGGGLAREARGDEVRRDELVIHAAGAERDARALVADRHGRAEAAETRAFRVEQVRGELLPLALRRGERYAGEGARRARGTGAGVVGADRAAEHRRLARKQHQVTTTFFRAGGEAAGDGGAGQVAGEEEPTVEQAHVRRRAGDHRMRDQLLQEFRGDAAVGGGINRHAAEAGFEHAQEDHAVLHFLLRHGDRGDVTLATVVERDLGGGVAEFFEGKRPADVTGEQRRELVGGDEQVAREGETLDRQRRALRLQDLDLGRGWGRADLGEARGRETPLDLVEQTAGVRRGLGPEFTPGTDQ